MRIQFLTHSLFLPGLAKSKSTAPPNYFTVTRGTETRLWIIAHIFRRDFCDDRVLANPPTNGPSGFRKEDGALADIPEL